MLTFYRTLRVAAFAGLVMLVGAAFARAEPGAPDWHTFNAHTATGLITGGSALGDLNGVSVEGTSLPEALE